MELQIVYKPLNRVFDDEQQLIESEFFDKERVICSKCNTELAKIDSIKKYNKNKFAIYSKCICCDELNILYYNKKQNQFRRKLNNGSKS